MTIIQITDREKKRLFILALIMFSGLGMLMFAMWFIQLGQGHCYRVSQDQQSLRRVRLPAVRGKIFDRRGICLADNEPDYGLCIYMDELRRSDKKRQTAQKAWELIQRLSKALEIEPQVTLKQINAHLSNRKPLPMTVWRHLDPKTMARFAEIGMHFPAADIMLDSKRTYPCGPAAAHLIGYAGAAKTGEADDDQQYHYYLPDLEGKRGIEHSYNRWLAGYAGGLLVRIDVSGFKHDETCQREPVNGGDLRLSVDMRLQRIAEQAIADACGAVVVMDPNNGEILAMASSPGFNLNLFSPGISVSSWQTLANDARKPLFNRAVSGLYPPGSTFKILVAIAALIQGKADENTSFYCNGSYELGGQIFSCHMGNAHGDINLGKALEVSCNVFFYKLGMQCGYDTIYHMAMASGFGAKTGLDLDAEACGFLPSKAWKRQTRGESWRDGDTCNISVGQGALLVTPIQMAVFTSAIANGGRLYRPRLVIGKRRHNQKDFEPVPPVLERELHWPENHLAAVKAGMVRVISEPTGTGYSAFLPGLSMAGKTGTAEFGLKHKGQSHGWMIVFAPVENPAYAVAMVLDEAISGGASIGPRLQRMLSEFIAVNGNEIIL